MEIKIILAIGAVLFIGALVLRYYLRIEPLKVYRPGKPAFEQSGVHTAFGWKKPGDGVRESATVQDLVGVVLKVAKAWFAKYRASFIEVHQAHHVSEELTPVQGGEVLEHTLTCDPGPDSSERLTLLHAEFELAQVPFANAENAQKTFYRLVLNRLASNACLARLTGQHIRMRYSPKVALSTCLPDGSTQQLELTFASEPEKEVGEDLGGLKLSSGLFTLSPGEAIGQVSVSIVESNVHETTLHEVATYLKAHEEVLSKMLTQVLTPPAPDGEA